MARRRGPPPKRPTPEVSINASAPPTDAFTVGVEEEYQLVDAGSGALRSRASDVRDTDWTGDVVGELQETQVEIGTPVCRSADEVAAELSRLRFQTATAAAAHGLALVAAGTHPFSDGLGHAVTPGERYARIIRTYARIARDEHIFGMHVHVAVPAAVDRIAIINVVRHFLPHLLALSASSPFFEGEDTGFASFRSILWRRWPSAGMPPRFASMDAYQEALRVQLAAGILLDAGTVYWSIRPHATYPTIELRVFDVCPRLEDAAGIAALARVIVHAIVAGAIAEPRRRARERTVEDAMLRANEWQAARYGLEARLVDTMAEPGEIPVRRAIARLLNRLMPIARELGDTDAIGAVQAILERGNATDRMRRIHTERGGMRALVDWLAAETLIGTGPDRRTAQREQGDDQGTG